MIRWIEERPLSASCPSFRPAMQMIFIINKAEDLQSQADWRIRCGAFCLRHCGRERRRLAAAHSRWARLRPGVGR